MRILLVEDDRTTGAYLVDGLRREGHDVDHSSDGPTGLELALTRSSDVLIVDRMLPGLDGLSVVRALRAVALRTPVIFLTAVSGIDDRVEGLEAGADDYLTKPFAFSELMARLNALGRRAPIKSDERVLRVGDLLLDLNRRTATRQSISLDLQPREYRLLDYMVRNRGRVLTRTMLLERVWDFNFDPKTSVVETHVSRLRAKVDRPFEREMIQTVRGSGYRLDVPA